MNHGTCTLSVPDMVEMASRTARSVASETNRTEASAMQMLAPAGCRLPHVAQVRSLPGMVVLSATHVYVAGMSNTLMPFAPRSTPVITQPRKPQAGHEPLATQWVVSATATVLLVPSRTPAVLVSLFSPNIRFARILSDPQSLKVQ